MVTLQAGDKLGAVVYWSTGGRDVPVAEVKTALVVAGLKEDWAYEPEKKNALIRALRKAEEGRICRRVSEDGREMRYQFTREFLAAQRLEYGYEAQVVLNKTNGAITFTSPEVEALVAQHLDHTATNFLPRDITALVQRILRREADLLPLRDRGAVYFVPVQFEALVAKVQHFLDAIGSRLDALTITNTNGTPKSVGAAFVAEMKAEMVDLEQQITEVEQTPEADLATRSVTMRLSHVKEMMERTKLYEELLSFTASDLRASLCSAQKRLIDKLEAL